MHDVSDEQGERFPQDFKTMEERNLRRWDKRMIADYYWNIKKLNNIEHDWHSRKIHFLP